MTKDCRTESWADMHDWTCYFKQKCTWDNCGGSRIPWEAFPLSAPYRVVTERHSVPRVISRHEPFSPSSWLTLMEVLVFISWLMVDDLLRTYKGWPIWILVLHPDTESALVSIALSTSGLISEVFLSLLFPSPSSLLIPGSFCESLSLLSYLLMGH